MNRLKLILATSILLLASCGGGGGSSSDGNDSEVVADSKCEIGSSWIGDCKI